MDIPSFFLKMMFHWSRGIIFVSEEASISILT